MRFVKPSWPKIQGYILQGFFVTLFLVSVLLLLTVIVRSYGNNPPIQLISLDPLELGEFCPGDSVPFNNQVTIDEPVMVTYHISVMEETLTFNMLGTDRHFDPLPHPRKATFRQEIAWSVPPLPPGRYARVLSARGTDVEEKSRYLWNFFSVKENCDA